MLVCNKNKPFSIVSGDQLWHEICSDEAGGAIITWVDSRNGGDIYDIYAQRIDSNGGLQWIDNGTAICSASKSQLNPQIYGSDNGRFIITWEDWRTGTANIYAQSINLSGVVQWTVNGIGISTADSHQLEPKICEGGDGGAIITWYDGRNLGSTAYDIYNQKVNMYGNVKWKTDGIALCTAIYDQEYPVICPDGAGGSIIVWCDERNGIGKIDIYRQVINSNGDKLLRGNGEVICSEKGSQSNLDIFNWGNKYAIITWQDSRNNVDIYAQRINIPKLLPNLGIIMTLILVSISVRYCLL